MASAAVGPAEALRQVEERVRPGVEHRAEAPLDPAQARLAVDAEVGAGLDAGAVVLDAIDRDAVAAEVERRLLERGAGERAHEARVPRSSGW